VMCAPSVGTVRFYEFVTERLFVDWTGVNRCLMNRQRVWQSCLCIKFVTTCRFHCNLLPFIVMTCGLATVSVIEVLVASNCLKLASSTWKINLAPISFDRNSSADTSPHRSTHKKFPSQQHRRTRSNKFLLAKEMAVSPTDQPSR
jgi:hypothetical protein